MIDLTNEQRQELANDTPVARDPRTLETYVLVRREVYDRFRQLLAEDEGLNKKEVAILVERAMKEYDEGDPSLDLYQNK
jgi:hypothetical protein